MARKKTAKPYTGMADRAIALLESVTKPAVTPEAAPNNDTDNMLRLEVSLDSLPGSVVNSVVLLQLLFNLSIAGAVAAIKEGRAYYDNSLIENQSDNISVFGGLRVYLRRPATNEHTPRTACATIMVAPSVAMSRLRDALEVIAQEDFSYDYDKLYDGCIDSLRTLSTYFRTLATKDGDRVAGSITKILNKVNDSD